MGKTYLGQEIKKLGFGFMRLPLLSDGAIDLEQSKNMVDTYLKAGYTYFDTAVPYHQQRSESALKTCLVDRHPREAYQVATKLSISFVNQEMTAEQLFASSLKNIGVDYVDFYLLHAMGRENRDKYDQVGAWDMVKRLKAEGKIRHFGLSFHDTADILDEILTAHPEAEFVQLQLNYADWENEKIQSRLCYEVAKKHGKPVIIMEPVKGGTLAELPAEVDKVLKDCRPQDTTASWAIRWAASLENIITILSGMSTIGQVENNLATMDSFTPLSDEERTALAKVVEMLDAMPTIPCTDCKYCVKDCPAQINIPMYFRLMNLHLTYDADPKLATNQGSFNFNAKGKTLPSACVACGRCQVACPQNIEIIQNLKEIAEIYE